MSGRRLLQAVAADTEQWVEQAACRAMNPALFHPAKGDTQGFRAAMAVCHDCEVREPCLDKALSYPPKDAQGIWGGTSEAQRHRLRYQRNQHRWGVG